MKELERSLEHYFGGTLTLLGEEGSSAAAQPSDGNLLPEYTQDSTIVRVSSSRLPCTGTVLWEFSGHREFSPQELEHLLQCSRMLKIREAQTFHTEELHYYMQIIEQLGRRSSDAVLLLDDGGGLKYQNSAAASRRIADRYRAYVHSSGDTRGQTRLEHQVSLEGTSPVQLEIRALYSGKRRLGLLIHATTRGRIPSEGVAERTPAGDAFLHLLGKHHTMTKTMKIARKAAATDATILLRGESGTGKEQFARAIHQISPRRTSPFIAINCAAIPENLLESELFGYEEGSFTGAARGGKIGKIEAAEAGTIFLDEIGDMPSHLQAKLLRVLQNREFERVGGTRSISVDVRFISATHRDLSILMEEGSFRPDLYYRLNVIPVHIPSLREHPQDIEIMLTYYLKKYAVQTGDAFSYFSFDALQILKQYGWPGNIRELENVVQYCMTMSGSGVIDVEELPPGIVPERISGQIEGPVPEKVHVQGPAGNGHAREQEIHELLLRFGHDTKGKRQAAQHLGISLATLYRRLGHRSDR
jgi:sigma-54 dependent transcriptional regulator, acetoin dehydrogenase operon transcriptional activator AcoR